MLVLWMQNVWGWSTIATGFAVAPGPAVVPIVAVLIQRLARKVQPGALTGIGCAIFAAGAVLVLTQLGPHGAEYATELLPDQLVACLGIGLALPTLIAAATHDLPAHRASTGSGVITMTRQVGYVLGVAVIVAILGTPTTYAAAHTRSCTAGGRSPAPRPSRRWSASVCSTAARTLDSPTHDYDYQQP